MKLHTAESLLESGREAKREHRLKYARSLFKKALDESRSSENKAMRATLYVELAYVERMLGEREHAATHYLRAAEVYRSLDDSLRTAHTARHAADLRRELGRRDESARLYVEVLEIYRARSDTPQLDVANAIRGFALLKGQMGATLEAIGLWQEAQDIYRLENIEEGVEESRRQIASLTTN